MQVNVVEAGVVRVTDVAERNIFKVDRAVGHFAHAVRLGLEAALFLQNFLDTLGRRARHDDHNHDHGQHHETHENLEGVVEHTGQCARGHGTADDQTCANPGDKQQAGVHAELHERHVEDNQTLGLEEAAEQLLGDRAELLLFKVLTHEGLDHADAGEVFLHDVVQLVVGVEYLRKQTVHAADNQRQTDAQNGNRAQVDGRKARADIYGHGKGKDQHDRGAHSDANNHLISVLHVGDVGRQTGDDTGGGKLIDVGERKVLYVVVDVVAQIACQTC